MPIISPQMMVQLEAYGLKVYPPVSVRTLPPEKVYHPNMSKDKLQQNWGGYNNYSYILKFKAPVQIYSNCQLSHCTIGAYSYINANSTLNVCEIGNYCSLGSNLCLGLAQHVTTSASTSVAFCPEDGFITKWTKGHFIKSQLSTYYPITIGHDVWIGNNVTIPAAHPITIGTGAIIAACSVVTKDVPPYAIVAGNPARLIKMRFSDELCADLFKSKWFEYDIPGFKHCEEMELHEPKLFLERFTYYRKDISRITEQYVQLSGL